ncbi:MAG: hypothetical protein BWZ01_02660 [Deltaproteobacteria bacterium ADurb.BinA179]|nr:MAG: hypothetical protein BWZ01_02660 [Deltaproteobacteria bacterium ADurb.BinA179]
MRFTSNPAILPASLVACLCESLKYAGTVITASSIFSPRYASASIFSFWRTMAEISGAAYFRSSTLMAVSPLSALAILKGMTCLSF